MARSLKRIFMKHIELQNKFIGKKFGKLEVVAVGQNDSLVQIAYCKCKCNQHLIVPMFDLQSKAKSACNNCSYTGRYAFKSGEIVVMKSNLAEIPRGEQLVVIEKIGNGRNPMLSVEYKGRRCKCFASEIETTGRRF